MTDSDVIKALEVCTTAGASCKNCPAYVKVDRSNCKEAFRGALDLINRQKAEIESQREYLNVSLIRAEAIKEFAERIKALFPSDDEPYQYWEIHEGVDNLVKEMVGE